MPTTTAAQTTGIVDLVGSDQYEEQGRGLLGTGTKAPTRALRAGTSGELCPRSSRHNTQGALQRAPSPRHHHGVREKHGRHLSRSAPSE
jgi:hypothetical protein